MEFYVKMCHLPLKIQYSVNIMIKETTTVITTEWLNYFMPLVKHLIIETVEDVNNFKRTFS